MSPKIKGKDTLADGALLLVGEGGPEVLKELGPVRGERIQHGLGAGVSDM